MALPYRFTARALNDLDNIWNYISENNLKAANRVEEAIFDACNRLARFPQLGSRRSEITALPVRFWTVTSFPNYIVVYRPDRKPLEIVAVLHGRRDLRAALEEPEAS